MPRAAPIWVSSEIHRALISRMVAARKQVGLTQRDVAAKIKKPPSFVGKVEGVERNISVLEFMAWTRALGVTPGSILDGLVAEVGDDLDI